MPRVRGQGPAKEYVFLRLFGGIEVQIVGWFGWFLRRMLLA